ncbi:MAG: formylmethanofuran dehydrogenase subunit E family protein [candidate division WOR-3 bacterium]|nr:MAG: formylmethanofuran dehydrogenase subunit E family protein [candidate division WOR-3 bacterium]
MKHKRLKPLTYAQTIRFHGHNGPFLALGYRLGEHVNTTLKPKGIMEYHITVYVRKEKPFTCVIDGLQCATFATTGKGNIQVKKRKEPGIRVKIVTAKRRLTFTSTTRALTLCHGQKDLERAASAVFKERFESLWNQDDQVAAQKAR